MSRRLVFLIAWACACSTTSEAAKRPPSSEELASLIQTAPKRTAGFEVDDSAAVDQWRMVGERALVIEGPAVEASNEAERAIVELAGPDALGGSQQCMARELAAFYEAEGGWPTAALELHMDAWCGEANRDRGITVRQLDSLGEWIDEGKQSPGRVRMGAARVGETDRWLVFASRDWVELDPVETVVGQTMVEISGRVLWKPGRLEGVWGRSTFGPMDSKYCNSDPSVRYPRFKMSCIATDQVTRISLNGNLKESSEVGEGLTTLTVFRGEAERLYRPRPIPKVAHTSTPESVHNAFVSMVNQLRAKVGREPLTVSRAQSEVVRQALPALDRALKDDDYGVADPLIAGLSAGWEIEGDLVDSSWTSRRGRGQELTHVVEGMWESPSTRDLLFHRDASDLALHVELSESDADSFRVAVFSYRRLREEHYNRRVTQVLDRLNELRAAYGRKPVRRIHSVGDGMAEIADRVTAGDLDARQGYERMRRYTSSKGVYGWTTWRTTRQLQHLSFSRRLLTQPNLQAQVAVAIERRPGFPFVRYVVFFIWKE